MGFPKMGKQPVRTVTMPELSGGINLRDSVTMVQDNQLTDGVNVWYKDAVLKTRPGLKGLKSDYLFLDQSTAGHKTENVKAKPTEIYRMINGKRYRLFTLVAGTDFEEKILLYFVSKDDYIEMPGISSADYADDAGIKNYILFEYKKDLYCFLLSKVDSKKPIVLRLNDTANLWDTLTENDFYVPLVFINGDMHGMYNTPSGTMYEGYNLFTHRYRMLFDADTAEANNTRYWILQKINSSIRPKLIGEKVIARLTDRNGNVVTHTVTINAQIPSVETAVGSDGLRMQVWEQGVLFSDGNGNGVPLPQCYKGLENNFELELPFWDDEHEAAKLKIFNMTQSTWFGGASAGINGGTRLFLCGNTAPQEKSLVIWSDLNKPLYFPENNYFYVGNSSQAVTGFGKQNEMLVIFKEREIFCTQYKQGASYTASDVISQNVVDVTAADAYFPLIQVHGSIGCDCPNSIQLCRNRLVWATSYGKVYTLVTNSQYSERNVYAISEMIEHRLKNEHAVDMQNALSCDWSGMYFLFVGTNAYVCDYNSYGYQYASAYSKSEDSNVKIPWWYWKLPDFNDENSAIFSLPYCACSNEDSISIGVIKIIQTGTEEAGTVQYFYNEIYSIDPAQKQDEIYSYLIEDVNEALGDDPELLGKKNREISCMLQTKIFDFGLPQKNKAVPLVNISFGNNGAKPIAVEYITENGVYNEQTVKLRHPHTTAYAAGYVRNQPLRPCVGLVSRFGLRLKCEGNMAVTAVTMNYRLTGGAK